MMFLQLMFFVALAGSSDVTLEPIRTYSALPEDSEYFIQNPGDLTLDKDGRLHVIDLRGKTVFVWNAEGKYVTNYGKAGQGPGEFTIMSRSGGPQAYITAIEDGIYVFDGGARRLQIFNNDLSFRKSLIFNVEAGRVEQFRVLPDGNFLVFYSSYFSDVAFRKAGIFKGDKEIVRELAKIKDETWRYITKGGDRRVELQIFSPDISLSFNEANQHIIMGDSSRPSFKILDMKGEEIDEVKVALAQREVTKEDIEEHKNITWIKNNDFFTVAYPDKRAYYDRVLPVGNNYYLIYLRSPFYGNLDGYLVDGKGTRLGRFSFSCGEGGKLHVADGRLFGTITDEDGEYSIVELKVTRDGQEIPGPR